MNLSAHAPMTIDIQLTPTWRTCLDASVALLLMADPPLSHAQAIERIVVAGIVSTTSTPAAGRSIAPQNDCALAIFVDLSARYGARRAIADGQ